MLQSNLAGNQEAIIFMHQVQKKIDKICKIRVDYGIFYENVCKTILKFIKYFSKYNKIKVLQQTEVKFCDLKTE